MKWPAILTTFLCLFLNSRIFISDADNFWTFFLFLLAAGLATASMIYLSLSKFTSGFWFGIASAVGFLLINAIGLTMLFAQSHPNNLPIAFGIIASLPLVLSGLAQLIVHVVGLRQLSRQPVPAAHKPPASDLTLTDVFTKILVTFCICLAIIGVIIFLFVVFMASGGLANFVN